MKKIQAQRKRRKVRNIFMNKKIRQWLAAAAIMVCALFGSVTPAFAQVDPDWEETAMAVEENLEEAENTQTEETSEVESNTGSEQEAAFSTPGNGELGDAITSGNKDFYTIQTKNNNTFYLVIDHSGNTDNVYMLSMIDENDLSEFMEGAVAEAEESPVLVVPEETQEPEAETEPETETEAEPEAEKEPGGNSGMATLLILGAMGAGAAIYYFKVYKPKKEEQEYESEGMETDDGLETENEDEETES